MTVAMHLAHKGVVPPEQWNHDCGLYNKNNGWITAMYIAYYCK